MKFSVIPAVVCTTIAVSTLPALWAEDADAPSPSPAEVQVEGTPESSTVGVVASLTSHSVVVRTAAGQHILFTLSRETVKPKNLAIGSKVRVVSGVGDDGLPAAQEIDIVPATEGPVVPAEAKPVPGTPAPTAESTDTVPQSVRSMEKSITKSARKYHGGVEGGVGLDPEVIVVGINAQFGPIFSKNLFFRPDVDFAWGEVTRAFQIDLDALYRLPLRNKTWTAYAGAGPNFSFVEQSFSRAESGNNSVSFSDFTFHAGLNLVGGMQSRSGLFYEMRVGVYTTPTVRLMVGYQF